jgi:hypothetical protein
MRVLNMSVEMLPFVRLKRRSRRTIKMVNSPEGEACFIDVVRANSELCSLEGYEAAEGLQPTSVKGRDVFNKGIERE